MKRTIPFLLISAAFLLSCAAYVPTSSEAFISSEASSSASSEVSSASSSVSSGVSSVSSSQESSVSSETSSASSSEASSISSESSVSSESSIASSEAKEADAHFIPTNAPYALDNSAWTTFNFYDEYGPMWATDWNYFYNSTHNPVSSGFYGGEDASKGNGANLEHKGQSLVSPLFQCWEKVEANFEVWFSSHTSNKYASTSGQPQLILKEYDKDGMEVGSMNIELEKSDVPKNGYYKMNLDLYANRMSFFELFYNNSVANGSSGYTFVIHSVSMKGWPYGAK